MPSFSSASMALVALVTLFSLSTITKGVDATSLTYNVAAHERACFYTWADEPSKKIGFYFAVQSGGSFDIDVEVKDPREKVLLALEKERQGDYVFTANDVGEYSFCFSNDMSTFAEKVVDFEIVVEHERRANAEQMNERESGTQAQAAAMDESVYRLHGELQRIDRMQKYFKTRESRNFSTVISTESRIYWFSLTESALIVAMSAFQVFVVRTFFSNSKRTYV
ncbi:hypothetical protein BGW38_001017 [Lunasporangiospora selenospora]|uniref:GOLD domain-containing protein n=1 Tax=Lunasporangiospora selenospora TaxID=979761 RepID=A0A9P6KEE3_9FUNG|nr:hypothetical protein BGW38_001017 [Lunasporangiospora selenospora]